MKRARQHFPEVRSVPASHVTTDFLVGTIGDDPCRGHPMVTEISVLIRTRTPASQLQLSMALCGIIRHQSETQASEIVQSLSGAVGTTV
jgi:hypothetical protein